MTAGDRRVLDRSGGQQSLAALESVLGALGVTGHDHPLALLRDLMQLRNLVPAHASYDERVFLAGRFGLVWPVTDWPAAWATLSARVADALRALRLAVQAINTEPATG